MPLLDLKNVCAGYGVIKVLHGISLHVDEGEIVTLIGSNGAGKSTTLRTISGLVPLRDGAILYRGASLARCAPHTIAIQGISHVPEGRGIFGNLTIRENLELAFFAACNRGPGSRRLAEVYEMFPVLGQRRRQGASTLSGGEQQMLAIGRAIIADGDLLMLDEPSMGLSPIFVKTIFKIIADIHRKGKTILLVEQNATMALNISNRAYVLENGRITASGVSRELAQNPALKAAYLG
jgi:branched-chain amino acid transport system ATP-binding protein